MWNSHQNSSIQIRSLRELLLWSEFHPNQHYGKLPISKAKFTIAKKLLSIENYHYPPMTKYFIWLKTKVIIIRRNTDSVNYFKLQKKIKNKKKNTFK